MDIAKIIGSTDVLDFKARRRSLIQRIGRVAAQPIFIEVGQPVSVVVGGFDPDAEAVRAIRELRPEVRVLYVTGFSRRRIPEGELREGQTELLAKPFDATDLSRRVASLLRSAPPIPGRDAPSGMLP